MKLLLERLLREEEGQSTTEYILILSVVVMIAMKFRTVIGSKLDSLVSKVGDDMMKATDGSN